MKRLTIAAIVIGVVAVIAVWVLRERPQPPTTPASVARERGPAPPGAPVAGSAARERAAPRLG